jgi:hypothetical protein
MTEITVIGEDSKAAALVQPLVTFLTNCLSSSQTHTPEI